MVAGDATQFRVIVDAFERTLLRTAFRFTGNWQDAEELTQTTFIRVFRSLRSYNLEQPFEPWLFRIHLNNCKSFCRRRQWQRLLRVPFTEVKASSEPAISDSNVDEWINEAIQALPWRQRAVFSLIEFEERTIAETAGMLGCAEATVRVHLHRAKQTLQKKLKGLIDE